MSEQHDDMTEESVYRTPGSADATDEASSLARAERGRTRRLDRRGSAAWNPWGLSVGMHRIRLEQFEEPYRMPDDERSAYRRRFITLFADDDTARHGGLGMVTRVSNAMGEVYALKVLIEPERAEAEDEAAYETRRAAAHAAFRAEYESHRAVSGFKGFPRLYGFAQVNGSPAIVMEWVEGVTLAQARRMLAVDDEGRCAPLTAARLGRDLFDLLVRLELVGDGFVHRDISPANVMVRTAHLSVAEQDAEGAFDLCLIDFGSSVNLDPAHDTSFTSRFSTMRCATLGYAPPEMLTSDLPHVARLRMSQKIDVYAAASVLYELVSGVLPFDMGVARDASPFRIKTDEQPRALTSAHMTHPDMAALLLREPEVAIAAGRASLDLSLGPDSAELRDALSLVDGQLFDLVLACLKPRQDERPTAEAMRDGLAAFCNHYAQNAERALRGERLLPCTGEASWFDTASPYAMNRLVSAVGGAIAVAVLAACTATTAVLLDGVPVVWRLGQLTWRSELSGFAVAAALMLPALAGWAARGRLRGTREGFLRGSTACIATTVALLAAASLGSISGLNSSHAVVSAILTAASAGWCPLVLDFAMTVAPAIIAEARRALPRARVQAAAMGGGACAAVASGGFDTAAAAVTAPLAPGALSDEDGAADEAVGAECAGGPADTVGADEPADHSDERDAIGERTADAVHHDSGDAPINGADPADNRLMIDGAESVTHNAIGNETGMKTGINSIDYSDEEVRDAADER